MSANPDPKPPKGAHWRRYRQPAPPPAVVQPQARRRFLAPERSLDPVRSPRPGHVEVMLGPARDASSPESIDLAAEVRRLATLRRHQRGWTAESIRTSAGTFPRRDHRAEEVA